MDFLSEIWQTISKNKSRSLLTAFGVFWGILMLMILMGLGNALTSGIYANVDGFALNSCAMGVSQTSIPYKGFQRGRSWDIYLSDLPKVQKQVEGIKCFSPMVFTNSNTVSRGDKHENYRLVGVTSEYPQVMATQMKYGRFINAIDMQERRKVCVLGIEVYEVLFPEGGNPVGQYVYCGNMQYKVIGVRAKNQNSVYIGGNPDQMVQAPLTTIQQVYNYGEVLHILMAVAEDGVEVAKIEKGIKDALRQIHQIAPNDEKALWGFNAEEQLKSLSYLRLGLTILIWLIGLGTLISGAVGVSNIMLVTVRERTKEIGIRRAIGASPWVIARQIMAESTLLTSLAGVVGIVAGVGVLAIIEMVLSRSDTFIQNPQVSFGAAVASLVIIVIVGLLAGLLPAVRALNIKPIEALSEE